MKARKITLVFFMSLYIGGCVATLPPAQQSTEPMDQADAVWVVTEDSPEEAYKKIAQTLQDKGFSISSSDATLQSITTEPREIDSSFYEQLSGSVVVKFNASVREYNGSTAVKINGQFNYDSDIENRGMDGSMYQRAWEAMLQTAQDYPTGELYFSRGI